MPTVETPSATMNPRQYAWWFPGSPVKIYLSLQVVRHLKERLAARDLRGLEEGLLFGTVRDGVTRIADFQPADHRPIPQLIAALSDEQKRSLVGYYRCEEGALRLNAKDRALAQECFNRPQDVFLMIRSNGFAPLAATFFFRDREGQMADFAFLEFPFDPVMLALEEHNRMHRSREAASAPAAMAPASGPVALP